MSAETAQILEVVQRVEVQGGRLDERIRSLTGVVEEVKEEQGQQRELLATTREDIAAFMGATVEQVKSAREDKRSRALIYIALITGSFGTIGAVFALIRAALANVGA